MANSITRRQVLGYRVRAQQLDRDTGGNLANTAVLDLGVQDTGPDGGMWALAIRGTDLSSVEDDALFLAWTVRGAPHLYRREDLPSVAAAVEPFSSEDASKRIYDAAKPLKAAGVDTIDAMDTVAKAMASVVTEPTVKGEVSARVTERMSSPYLRFCRPCDAIHLYEMPFRLAALRAGLELQPGTSPPVLQPIPDFARSGKPQRKHDVVRAYLRLLGPATPKHVAEYLDATLKDVRARWPDDAVEVDVAGERRWLLAADLERLEAPERSTRLLGPFDLFLQARDRPLLVDDPARIKALWPVLGRPGAILDGGEIAGIWRPRKSGRKLTVLLELWRRDTARLRNAIALQAERLAAFRRIQLGDVRIDE